MHIISYKAIREFGGANPDAAAPLDRWYRVAKRAEWANFAELRADFPSADQVNRFTVFNVGGTKFRLVAEIYFDNQVLLIRGVYSHRDYSRLDLSV